MRDGREMVLGMDPIPIVASAARTSTASVSSDPVDELGHAQRRLRETAELLRIAQEAAAAGIWAWDVKRGMVWLSPECARLNSVPYDPVSDCDGVEVPIEDWLAHVHEKDRVRVEMENRRAIIDRQGFEIELRVRRSMRSDEGWRWLHSIGKIVLDENSGEATRIVGFDVDITRRKEAEAQMTHLACHDGLTGLANRRYFYARLDLAVTEARRDGRRLSIFAVDLDRFKWVNDTHGHSVGDGVLRCAATAIASAASGADLVARLGGDEFAIIRSTYGYETSDDCAFARRLIETIVGMSATGEHAVAVGASVGIAAFPNDASDADNLFKAADLAVRSVKKSGGGSFAVYTMDLQEAERRRHALEQDLRLALSRGEFELHYQPICDAGDGRVVSFEALLRWHHPVMGMLSPLDFIVLAEETGLIDEIGDWVLRTACTAAASWHDGIGVAVNVSAIQLRRVAFPLNVTAALAASGLTPHRLEIEITETALVQEPRSTDCIEDLRRLGVRIALDDFGTGYSSLSYLLHLNFDRIKLDRTFITNINDPRSHIIVGSVVALGKALGMAITAEGVETEEQLEVARSYGCTEMQGYLFGRPTAKADASSWTACQSVFAGLWPAAGFVDTEIRCFHEAGGGKCNDGSSGVSSR